MTDQQPRLFQIWLDASDGSIATHDGVQWPDGTADVHHRYRRPDGVQWSPKSLAQQVHGKLARIEWAPDGAGDLRERVEHAEAQVARIRAFLEDMATWCFPHGVAADYARRGLDALDGIDPFDAIRAKRQDREDTLDAAIAHTALAAIRDYVEASDDTGIRTREHLLGILNEAGVPSVVAEELDGADRYADMVNAPLRPETIAAIAERLKSGDFPVRKVRARVRDMGREPAVMAIPDDELQPLLALADDEPVRELTLPQVMAFHRLAGQIIDQAQSARWTASGRCGTCGFDGDRTGCQDCDGGKA